MDLPFRIENKDSLGLWGINIYNTDPSDPRKFEYLIAVASDLEVSDEFSEYTVPAMTWAVFSCTRETIGKTEAQAITKWLPKSKYRPLNKGYITGRMKSGAPDMEYCGKDGQAEVICKRMADPTACNPKCSMGYDFWLKGEHYA